MNEYCKPIKVPMLLTFMTSTGNENISEALLLLDMIICYYILVLISSVRFNDQIAL